MRVTVKPQRTYRKIKAHQCFYFDIKAFYINSSRGRLQDEDLNFLLTLKVSMHRLMFDDYRGF